MSTVTDVSKHFNVPFTCISIETGSKCNRACTFCPVGESAREDEWMPIEMIEKILDDLVAMNYKQRVVFHSYNEPMRDKRLLDFIKLFRARLPKICMQFNTNGDYIKTADDVKVYFLAGLNQMQINCYSSGDGSNNPTRVANGIAAAEKRYAFLKGIIDSIEWLDQKASIYNHIGASGKACQVVPKWGFRPTESHDNHAQTRGKNLSTRHHLANRAGNVPKFMPPLTEPLKKMCVRPFREMIVNWRGDVILCCNAYSRTDANGGDTAVGNVMERSLIDLFSDDRLNMYRVKLQAKDRNIFLCDKCDYDGGFYQHNVPHVTFGEERDAEIIAADMRSPQSVGLAPLEKLVQIGRKPE